MQESLVFLILGVGRLREDQLIYVETRENMFFYDMGPLNLAVADYTEQMLSTICMYVDTEIMI